MRKFRLILSCLALLLCISTKSNAQFYSVQTNVIDWASGTFNFEGSMALDLHWTVNLPVKYNPWTFRNNRKIKQFTIMPGARYWFRETYGHSWFIGANAMGSRFNVGGILGSKYRYDGRFWGVSLSGGFSMPLAKRWNMEFEGGVGLGYGSYDKYNCSRCSESLKYESGFMAVPSKAAVTMVFLF